MKITIIQGAFLPVPALRGGAVEKVWFSLGQEFAKAGHEVTHISRHFEGLPRTEVIGGVRHQRVKGFDAPASLKVRLGLDLIYSLRARVATPKSDIVITNTFWLPILCRTRSLGRIYAHVARYPKGQLRFYGKQVVLQTVSEPIRKAILRELPDANLRCSVVPYPLSPAYFKANREEKRKTILYVGRLHPEKGLDLLIKAYSEVKSQLQDWTLRIVGPWLHQQGGAGEAYLATLKEQAHGVRVEFVGPVFDEAALVAEYQRASVFCYPSLAETGETFGLSVLEAMAGGAVPVVSALECFGDFLSSGENGIIFDHRKPKASRLLSAALLQATQDTDLRESLQKKAAKTAARHTLQAVTQRYLHDFSHFITQP